MFGFDTSQSKDPSRLSATQLNGEPAVKLTHQTPSIWVNCNYSPTQLFGHFLESILPKQKSVVWSLYGYFGREIACPDQLKQTTSRIFKLRSFNG